MLLFYCKKAIYERISFEQLFTYFICRFAFFIVINELLNVNCWHVCRPFCLLLFLYLNVLYYMLLFIVKRPFTNEYLFEQLFIYLICRFAFIIVINELLNVNCWHVCRTFCLLLLLLLNVCWWLEWICNRMLWWRLKLKCCSLRKNIHILVCKI